MGGNARSLGSQGGNLTTATRWEFDKLIASIRGITLTDFDAIVVGSGMSGGWSAKELAERGLKVLVLERGPEVIPERDFKDQLSPWGKSVV